MDNKSLVVSSNEDTKNIVAKLLSDKYDELVLFNYKRQILLLQELETHYDVLTISSINFYGLVMKNEEEVDIFCTFLLDYTKLTSINLSGSNCFQFDKVVNTLSKMYHLEKLSMGYLHVYGGSRHVTTIIKDLKKLKYLSLYKNKVTNFREILSIAKNNCIEYIDFTKSEALSDKRINILLDSLRNHDHKLTLDFQSCYVPHYYHERLSEFQIENNKIMLIFHEDED